jgi:hypothetical protein
MDRILLFSNKVKILISAMPRNTVTVNFHPILKYELRSIAAHETGVYWLFLSAWDKCSVQLLT